MASSVISIPIDNHVIDAFFVVTLVFTVDRRYILCFADSSIRPDEVYTMSPVSMHLFIYSAFEGVGGGGRVGYIVGLATGWSWVRI